MFFPPEVWEIILLQATLCRGVRRALRLRLVCKAFDKIIYYRALFESHLLDHERVKPRHSRETVYLETVYMCNSNDHGVAKLWHDYLVYRAMGEHDASIGRFVEIRQLAQAVIAEDPSKDLRGVVDSLCWLALDSGVKAPGLYMNWTRTIDFELIRPKKRPEPRLSLLAAAAFFDMMPLVSELLAEGHSPIKHNHLFPPAVQVAAQSGNTAMVKLFRGLPSSSGFEPYALFGAAVRGDMEMMRLVFPKRSGNGPDEEGYAVYPLHGRAKKWFIPKARRNTSSPEVYEYLSNACSAGRRTARNYTDLVSHAGRGNLEMVEYLLARGVAVDAVNSEELESALERACRKGQDKVVDLLLARGADVNYVSHALWGASPVCMAAAGGHISIMRKLIEHGADLEKKGGEAGRFRDAMQWAYHLEHAQMIKLLLDSGVTIRDGDSLATLLSRMGYESMVSDLRRRGFEPNEPKDGLPLPGES